MEPTFGPPHGVTFRELRPQVKAAMTDCRMICTFTPTDTDSHNAHPASQVSLRLSFFFIRFAALAEKKKTKQPTFFVK